MEECAEESQESALSTSHWFLEAAKLHPSTLVNALKENPQDCDTQEKLFRHTSNRACRQHYGPRGDPVGDLEPSQWIDIEITDEQRRLLKPTQKDLLLSSVEEDAYGDGANKKRARRRQDMNDGNAKSYSRILNSDKRMESYKEWNELQAGLSMVRRDKDNKREMKATEKRRATEQNELKKAEQEAAEKAQKEALIPKLKEDIKKGFEHISSLYCSRLKNMLSCTCTKSPRKTSTKWHFVEETISDQLTPP
jgi:hypothetical protein